MGFDDDLMNMDGECMEELGTPLPGFRFHPTDEELVGFYLRRKLDKKPITLQLFKQIDIYKYDPWDLPKGNSSGGEKECYFFCRRGRKYRNSIRPNRVTGSGFWKATGIDKPVYNSSLGRGGEGCDQYCCNNNNNIIGLKKTLVYYRGSAGKGTKTEWMMHEFRLPTSTNIDNTNPACAQEAEIWTLCKIFKRNVSQRKHYTTELRQLGSKRLSTDNMTGTKSVEYYNTNQEAYISFDTNNDHKPVINNNNNANIIDQRHEPHVGQLSSPVAQKPAAPSSNWWTTPKANDFFTFENWDELGSIVKFGVESPIM